MMATVSSDDLTSRSVNPAFERILGSTEDTLLGRTFVEIVHPDERDDLGISIAATERNDPIGVERRPVASMRLPLDCVVMARAGGALLNCIGPDVTDRREATGGRRFCSS